MIDRAHYAVNIVAITALQNHLQVLDERTQIVWNEAAPSHGWSKLSCCIPVEYQLVEHGGDAIARLPQDSKGLAANQQLAGVAYTIKAAATMIMHVELQARRRSARTANEIFVHVGETRWHACGPLATVEKPFEERAAASLWRAVVMKNHRRRSRGCRSMPKAVPG
jgi:hypothetical protein